MMEKKSISNLVEKSQSQRLANFRPRVAVDLFRRTFGSNRIKLLEISDVTSIYCTIKLQLKII